MQLICLLSLWHACNRSNELPKENINNVKRTMKSLTQCSILYWCRRYKNTLKLEILFIKKWVLQIPLKDVRLLAKGFITSLKTQIISNYRKHKLQNGMLKKKMQECLLCFFLRAWTIVAFLQGHTLLSCSMSMPQSLTEWCNSLNLRWAKCRQVCTYSKTHLELWKCTYMK